MIAQNANVLRELQTMKQTLICKLANRSGFDLTRLRLEMSLGKECVILNKLPILELGLLMFGSI